MKLKLTKKEIIELLIVIVFVCLSIFFCRYHEYWADEAHAWLIARDSSVYELFSKYLHSDGHPALWHLVIKFFQFCGLEYKYFFIISVLFSSLGVAIFVIKSKFPLYLKVLFPFTYFIFFQYTIVVRGYCLIFFILSWLATIYDKRHEKIFLFTFLMILLLSSESYTFFFAGMLFLVYFYEYIKEYKNYDKNLRIKHIISFIVLGILFCFTVWYVYPYDTNTFNPLNISYYISSSFITRYRRAYTLFQTILYFLLSLVVIYFIYKGYKNERKKLIEMLFLLSIMFVFLIFRYSNAWHMGIVFLLFVFIFWIHGMENNKYILFLLTISSVIQIYWSVCSINYEVKNSYTGAPAAAEFVKKYDYENLKIFGINFFCSALNPYFEKNIYSNWEEKIGFFYWDSSSKYYDIEEEDFVEHIINNDYDMVVVSSKIYFDIYDELKNKYNYYDFEGNTFIEVSKYENQSYRIFVKKSIDIG